MAQGLEVTAILQAGVQLAVFDHIAAGKDQPSAIATAIDADERGTRILLDALAPLGLFERNNGYQLTPLAETFLVTNRPSYLGGLLNIFAPPWHGAAINVWPRWCATAAPCLNSTPRHPSMSSGRRSRPPARAWLSRPRR
jgi:hypothetical protein